MKTMRNLFTMTLVLPLLIGACNLPVSGINNQNQQAPAVGGQTQVSRDEAEKMMQTISVIQTSLAVTPQATNTQVPATLQNTNTPNPTFTNTPTTEGTKVPQVGITSIATQIPKPCNRANFVADVTVPDYTRFYKGTSFTKTWRIRNDGSCTWTTGYALVFDHGASLNGASRTSLNHLVAPGETIDLSVYLLAPSSDGTYQGYWRLMDDKGQLFGIGDQANISFWVKIIVGVLIVDISTPVVSGNCSLVSSSPASYSTFAPNADIDARWKIKNLSSTTWHADQVDYKYISGKRMYKFDSAYDLPSDVSHDHTITIIVDVKTPDEPGTYTMTWGLVRSSTRLCTMSVTLKVH